MSQLLIKEPRSSTDGKLESDSRWRRSRYSSDGEEEILKDSFINEDLSWGASTCALFL